ncbi:acyl carrier protein [Campylobacter vicugnae]|uniref:acyl carrier protein n=1 Tax=Campylobacter vicugnae TaxID=1660076 RepID=UPI00254ACC7A|nr:acyl carrier protein [Campylobacter ovis]MDL0104416.1 acyl carrier protein [Campylobacter ovis]MDL0106404.1 acyl carrier protein [Campylobacter ovis]
MKEIKELFNKIGKSDIDESMTNLLSDGIIDSMDIMALAVEIEKLYKKPLKSKFIINENFESFESICKMLDEAMQ